MLCRIFSNPDSVIIGFGFSSDVEQFARKLPHLNFIKYVQNFIDAQAYFGKVYLVEQQTGLAKVAQKIFNKSICKVEQMSNWERRPLRQSQQHYGSLDAYILIDMVKHLIQKAESNGLPPFKKFIKTLDNRKILIKADDDEFDDFERQKNMDERVVVQPTLKNNKRKTFGNGPRQPGDSNGNKPYGNSYGKKG